MNWELNSDKGEPHSALSEVLLAQYAKQTRRAAQPELRLVAAVLQDALDCLRGTRGREFLETRDWFLADRHDWPFSFANVCEELGLDPKAVRKRLRPILELRQTFKNSATDDTNNSSGSASMTLLLKQREP
jgi:hypothetical protein